MARRGKSARDKGAQGEREFFAVLNKFLPERLRLKRILGQARDGGSDGEGSGLVIEVKRQERLVLNKWLEQARLAANGSVPVVAYRQNNDQWHILVDMTPVQLAAYMRNREKLESTEQELSESLSRASNLP